jgi:large subunit ribosomal protein L22
MAIARLSHARITPRKARIIANLIRGKQVARAIDDLRFLHKSGAKQFFKLLVSAVANAEDTGDVNVDKLVVSDVQIDKAGVMRRYLPRAHGRATPIRKQLAHVSVQLVERE